MQINHVHMYNINIYIYVYIYMMINYNRTYTFSTKRSWHVWLFPISIGTYIDCKGATKNFPNSPKPGYP